MLNANKWPTSLVEAVRYFSDPKRCQDFLISMRWPDGVVCPSCGSRELSYLSTRRLWKCKTKHAQQQFSIKKGSIFEDSPLGLDKWLVAMWLIVSCKNGVSSYELARAVKVTQQTAWFVLHRIRTAMHRGTFEKFGGEVEADETFIGAKARNMHRGKWSKIREARAKGRSNAGRAVVMGVLQRHGKVRVAHVPDLKKSTLQAQITSSVVPGSRVYTDELLSYRGLDKQYVHNIINHAESYVEGNIHTNGIENFWSLLKRTIRGTYVSVEPFHLFRYLDEQSFRFNERKTTDAKRFIEAASTAFGRRLTYKELTGDQQQLTATA
jgi:transposase-like protein